MIYLYLDDGQENSTLEDQSYMCYRVWLGVQLRSKVTCSTAEMRGCWAGLSGNCDWRRWPAWRSTNGRHGDQKTKLIWSAAANGMYRLGDAVSAGLRYVVFP